ncbi:hypothetical protein RHSIM_Rhsim09G0003300 [Rhododendron simsii]|uniref:Uncharacterized protein n=1 Tax=Rhododendron simsii TaxID=118357 RepID=A0A834GDJ8_RHOSS|nr:hypothetical protein RHSIM_Rhsim09G0003300 [Rhododendron simsii]
MTEEPSFAAVMAEEPSFATVMSSFGESSFMVPSFAFGTATDACGTVMALVSVTRSVMLVLLGYCFVSAFMPCFASVNGDVDTMFHSKPSHIKVGNALTDDYHDHLRLVRVYVVSCLIRLWIWLLRNMDKLIHIASSLLCALLLLACQVSNRRWRVRMRTLCIQGLITFDAYIQFHKLALFQWHHGYSVARSRWLVTLDGHTIHAPRSIQLSVVYFNQPEVPKALHVHSEKALSKWDIYLQVSLIKLHADLWLHHPRVHHSYNIAIVQGRDEGQSFPFSKNCIDESLGSIEIEMPKWVGRLIPLVCKTFKKNQTRRKYKCLSSSGATHAYNIADFYPQGFNYQYSTPQMEIKTRTTGVSSQHHHLRHSTSLREHSSGFSAAGDQDMVIMKPKQLVRFRSHRFFSCVTGGA